MAKKDKVTAAKAAFKSYVQQGNKGNIAVELSDLYLFWT